MEKGPQYITSIWKKGPQYITSIWKRVHNTLVNTENVHNILFNVEKGPQYISLKSVHNKLVQ